MWIISIMTISTQLLLFADGAYMWLWQNAVEINMLFFPFLHSVAHFMLMHYSYVLH